MKSIFWICQIRAEDAGAYDRRRIDLGDERAITCLAPVPLTTTGKKPSPPAALLMDVTATSMRPHLLRRYASGSGRPVSGFIKLRRLRAQGIGEIDGLEIVAIK